METPTELKDMSFAELLALRTFIGETIGHLESCKGNPEIETWKHHKGVIIQIIEKKLYEYYSIPRLR